MRIQIIKAANTKTTSWSGGTTTQLYIHPKEASYAKKDFFFRLSSALVTDPESVFTPLPMVTRKLMVLEGSIELSHKNKHIETLSKFDVATFDGGWHTSCKGTCSDFNLMLKGATQGVLEGASLAKKETLEKSIEPETMFLFLYVAKGEIQVALANKAHSLQQGDVFMVENPLLKTLHLTGIVPSDVVSTSITHLNS